ncbi:MAG: MOSC domain-containing protein [Rhodoferax sp.]
MSDAHPLDGAQAPDAKAVGEFGSVVRFQLLGLQTGRAAPLLAQGRVVHSAIRKTAVEGPVAVQPLGLAGDEQVDLSVHGGLDKAVYAYPHEHYAFWAQERAERAVTEGLQSLPLGSLGENLSLQGLVEAQLWMGDLLHFPDCVLRVSQPREPCYKFNAVMGFAQAAKRMVQSQHCGFYLAVHTPGTLRAGESGWLQAGPRRESLLQRFAIKAAKHLRFD